MLGVLREVEKEARKEKKVKQLFRKRESKKNFIIISQALFWKIKNGYKFFSTFPIRRWGSMSLPLESSGFHHCSDKIQQK